MKKGKIVLLVILFLLLALVGGALFYCYPRWQSAMALEENVDLEHFVYEIELELNEEELSKEASEAFQTLSQITGYTADSFYNLRIEGNVWEDKIYVELYTEVTDEAVLELYLSDDKDIINGTMLYNAFRAKMVGDSSILGAMIPVMEAGVYMTVEQAEQMFGLDLSILSKFSIDTDDLEFTQQEYFILLALMSREKQSDGSQFAFAYETAQAQLSVSEEDDFAARAQVEVEEPMKLVEQLGDKLTSFGVEIPTEGLEVFERISVAVEPGEGAEIAIPTNIMSQDMVKVFTEARALIEQFSGK